MRYKVSGASRHSGRESVMIVDGDDAIDAERRAQQLGLLVSRVEPEISTPVEEQKSSGVPTCQLCGAAPLVKQRYHVLGAPMAIVGLVLSAVSGLGAIALSVGFYLAWTQDPEHPPTNQTVVAYVVGFAGLFFYFALGYVLALSRRVLRCLKCDAAFPAR